MRLEVRPHLVLAAAGLLASPSAAQDPFVERALEVGLVHECLTGRDRLGEGAIQDWIQQSFRIMAKPPNRPNTAPIVVATLGENTV